MNIQNTQRKVVVIGDSNVGKTCLLERLVDNVFNDKTEPTISNNTSKYQTKVNDKEVNLIIWDTAGQEKYRSLTSVYFRDSQAAIIVFDATNEDPQPEIQSWLSSFRSTVGNKSFVVLAANKSDLVSNKEALNARCLELQTEFNGTPVNVVSAKDGEGVKELFDLVAEKVSEIEVEMPIVDFGQQKKKSSCC